MTAPSLLIAEAMPPPPALRTARRMNWDIIRNQLDWLNKIAAQDLIQVFNRAKELPTNEARSYLEQAMRLLIDTYGGVSSEFTAEWLDGMVGEIAAATPVSLAPVEQITSEVKWGTAPILEGTDPRTRLMLVLQKHIFGAQRDTVDEWATHVGTRWARHARADACAFCRLLASRGAVYGSAARAKYVGMGGMQKHYVDGKERGARFKKGRVRGERAAGATYHDHCRCIIGPEVGNLDLNLPDYYMDFEAEYDQAVEDLMASDDWNGVITMKNVTKYMRAAGHGA